MKKYTVLLERNAERALYDVPKSAVRPVIESLDSLESDPRHPGAKRLLNQEGYRIRKGKYRILFTVDDAARVVRVYRIGHRRDVYR
jgi:mRNA interferase RelE/StbE